MSRVTAAFALSLSLTLLLPPASAQEATLVLGAAAPFLDCDEEVAIELRVSSEEVAVWGYQVYLRYPATLVTPLRFEPEAIDRSVWVGGPESMEADYAHDSCTEDLADPWGDGRGEDVVSILATVFDESTVGVADEPVSGADVLLGRLVFAPVDGGPLPEALAFAWNDGVCREPFDQATRVFDAEGLALALELAEDPTFAIVRGGPVSGLVCEEAEEGIVDLAWELPAGLEAQAIRVDRNDETVATVAGDATGYRDADLAGLDVVRYTVTPVLAGELDGCASASCTLTLVDVLFFRGDADLNGRLQISDGVVILRHLFQGGAIGCEDAADSNDNGRLELSDAISALNFLFGRGPELPPPGAPTPLNEVPGVDPTDDELGCEQGV